MFFPRLLIKLSALRSVYQDLKTKTIHSWYFGKDLLVVQLVVNCLVVVLLRTIGLSALAPLFWVKVISSAIFSQWHFSRLAPQVIFFHNLGTKKYHLLAGVTFIDLGILSMLIVPN